MILDQFRIRFAYEKIETSEAYQCLLIKSAFRVPPQSADATHALNLSAGVSNSSVFRGRSLS